LKISLRLLTNDKEGKATESPTQGVDTMNKILMMTPEGEEVDVDQKNFDAAIAKGLEPALEYVTPDGETVVVRKKNFDAAEKQGLVMKPLYEARKAPMPSLGKNSRSGIWRSTMDATRAF